MVEYDRLSVEDNVTLCGYVFIHSLSKVEIVEVLKTICEFWLKNE